MIKTGSRSTVPGGSSGGRRLLLAGGGAGGGDESGEESHSSANAVNQQIAQALVRLQHDMTNVLDRLNRLEAQTRHNQVQWNLENSNVFNCFFTSCLILLNSNMIINRIINSVHFKYQNHKFKFA